MVFYWLTRQGFDSANPFTSMARKELLLILNTIHEFFQRLEGKLHRRVQKRHGVRIPVVLAVEYGGWNHGPLQISFDQIPKPFILRDARIEIMGDLGYYLSHFGRKDEKAGESCARITRLLFFCREKEGAIPDRGGGPQHVDIVTLNNLHLLPPARAALKKGNMLIQSKQIGRMASRKNYRFWRQGIPNSRGGIQDGGQAEQFDVRKGVARPHKADCKQITEQFLCPGKKPIPRPMELFCCRSCHHA